MNGRASKYLRKVARKEVRRLWMEMLTASLWGRLTFCFKVLFKVPYNIRGEMERIFHRIMSEKGGK